jgi:hypothetical protein
MNSYQKLKKEVQYLKLKLLIVCLEPNSTKAILIREEEKLKRQLEKALWAGNAITKETYGE